LIRVAEFLGVSCESIELPQTGPGWSETLKAISRNGDSCLVIHPQVFEQCLTSEVECRQLAGLLVSEFRNLLVYAPREKHFDACLLSSLSDGAVKGIRELTSHHSPEVARLESEMCASFADLSILHKQTSLCTLDIAERDASVRTAISIGSGAVLAAMKKGKAQIVYIAGAELADVDEPVGDAPVSEFFLPFLPYAIALRHIFGEESWRPGD